MKKIEKITRDKLSNSGVGGHFHFSTLEYMIDVAIRNINRLSTEYLKWAMRDEYVLRSMDTRIVEINAIHNVVYRRGISCYRLLSGPFVRGDGGASSPTYFIRFTMDTSNVAILLCVPGLDC